MKTIFVSSTFRDFQQERDILHDRVLPVLNAQGRKYGEEVSFCDLRWGVDTSDEADEDKSSAKVLSVCMNEIDRSRPYMLVLLGERYGFMPGEKAIEREAKRKEMELEQLEISVTALEVEYGALLHKETLENTWFYFRELTTEEELPPEFLAESQEHKRKLDQLKERICRLAGDRVRFYQASWKDGEVTGLEDFTEQVKQDVKEQLRSEWEAYERLDPYERDALSQWNYMHEKARSFTVFSEFADETAARLAGPEPVTVVAGRAGSGKSTLFAKVCQDMRARGFKVFPFVCGSTSLTTDAFGIMRSLVWQLETFLGMGHMEETERTKPDDLQSDKAICTMEEWREHLDSLCLKVASACRILIAVDALDQLQAGEMRDLLKFLPSVRSEGIRIFLTCLDHYNTPGSFTRIPMPKMNKEEKRQVVKGILRSIGKELSAPVIDALMQKEQGNTPLYLYLAVSRLTLMNASDFQNIRDRGDGIEGITARQMELVDEMPDELEDMSVTLIEAVGERVNPVLSGNVIDYLALSRLGFRLMDLEELLRAAGLTFQPLEFAQFVNYMNELFLLRSDGRYDFLHKSLRQGILRRMRAQGREEFKGHERIAAYLETLPEDDVIRIQEMTWESMKADNIRAFIYWLSVIWSYDGEEPEKAAIRDIAQQCREDGGNWIEHTLGSLWEQEFKSEDDRDQAIITSAYFLAVTVCPELGESLRENRVRIRVAGAAVANMERLSKEKPTPENRECLTHCCRSLAEYLLNSDQISERKMAIELLKKTHQIREEMLGEQPEKEADHRLRLSQIDGQLSMAYYMQEDAESLKNARIYGEAALQYQEEARGKVDTFAELTMRVNSRMRIAEVCIRQKDSDSLHVAYSHIHACIQEMEELLAEGYTKEYLDTLGKLYLAVVQVCRGISETGEADLYEEGLAYAERGLEILQECEHRRSDPKTREALASAWNVVGSSHSHLKGEEHRKEAVRCLLEALKIHQSLAEELGTPKERYSLANAYGMLADAYEQLDSGEGMKTVLMYAGQGEKVAAVLAKELPTLPNRDLWLTLLKYVERSARAYGDYLRKEGGESEEILKSYEEALEGSRRWVTEEATEESRRELSLNLHRLGRFYREKDQREDFDKAYDYYKEYSQLAQELEDETCRAKREVRNSYYWLGDLMEAYGDEVHLQEAILCYEEYHKRCLDVELLTEEEQDRNETEKSRYRLYMAYQFMEGYLRDKEDQETFGKRLELQKKCIETYMEVPEEERTDEQWWLIGVGCLNLGNLYTWLGGEENLTASLNQFYMAMISMERVQNKDEERYGILAQTCLAAFSVCSMLETEEGPEWIAFEEGYVRCLEHLSKGWEHREYLKELNKWSYDLGALYDKLEGKDALLEVIRCYKLEVWSYERLLTTMQEEDSDEIRKLEEELSDACYRTAVRLERLGGKEALEEAIFYEKRDVELSRKCVEKVPDIDNVNNLAASLRQLGRICAKSEGEEYKREAILCYEEELALRRQMIEIDPSIKGKEALSLCCYNLSGLYLALGGRDNILYAREYCNMDIELMEELVKIEPTIQHKRDICGSLKRARLVEETLGDEEARKKALVMQEKIVRFREEILEEEPSDKHREEYEDAKNKLQELR